MTSIVPVVLKSRGASKTEGEWAATPPWLTDTEIPAPCFCGRPFMHGDSVAFWTHGDTGLKRIFHLECAQEVGLINGIDRSG